MIDKQMNRPSPATPPSPSQLHGHDGLSHRTRGRHSEPLLITSSSEEIAMQFRSLVLWFWRLRWWLMLAMVVGGFLGALAGLTVLRNHTAYAMMRVLTTQHENPLGDFERSAIRFYHSPTTAFPADALITDTLVRLDGDQPSMRDIYQASRSLNIIDYGNDVYRVSYRHENPDRALAFLTTHLEVYQESERERNLQAMRKEVTRLEESLAEVEQRMAEAQDRIRVFKTEHADALPEFAGTNLQNLRNAENEVADLEARIKDLEIERAHVMQRLQEEPRTTTIQIEEARTEGRLQALRAEIANLRANGLTSDHPQLRRMLAEEKLLDEDERLRRNMDATSTEIVPSESYNDLLLQRDAITIAHTQAERQLEDARKRVERARGLVVSVPALEQRFTELSRGQESDLSAYEQIRLVLEKARLQLALETDAAESRLEIFNPPRLLFSSGIVRLVATTIVGMILGFVLVVGIWSLVRIRRIVWSEGFSGENYR